MTQRSSIVVLIAVVVVRIAAMLVLLKYLSLTFGPEGLGTLSQVMGIAAIIYMFAGGGVSNGLIKHIAEDGSIEARSAWAGAAGFVCLAMSTILLIVSITLYFVGAQALLLDPGLAPVFILIGFAQFVVGAGSVAQGYLSGAGDLRGFAVSNVVGSVLGLALVLALSVLGGYSGATLGVALIAVGPAFTAIILMVRRRAAAIAWPADRAKIFNLLKFSAVSIVSVSAVPLALLYVRADLADAEGWRTVGYWQVVSRASDAYMQVFGVLFINFFLPQLAGQNGRGKLEILKRYGFVFVALFACGALSFYFAREPVIRAAFSSEFLPAASFVAPQLMGDMAKVGTWIFVYYFVSLSKVWVQGFAEIAQAIVMILAYSLLLPVLGPHATVVGHMVACLTVFLATSGFFVVYRLSAGT